MPLKPGDSVEIGPETTVYKQLGCPEPAPTPLALLNLLTPMAMDNVRLHRRVDHLELVMWVINDNYGVTFAPQHAKLLTWVLEYDQDK